MKKFEQLKKSELEAMRLDSKKDLMETWNDYGSRAYLLRRDEQNDSFRCKQLKERRDIAETRYETVRKAGKNPETIEKLGNLALCIGDDLNSAIADLHYGVCQLLEQYYSKPTPIAHHT